MVGALDLLGLGLANLQQLPASWLPAALTKQLQWVGDLGVLGDLPVQPVLLVLVLVVVVAAEGQLHLRHLQLHLRVEELGQPS